MANSKPPVAPPAAAAALTRSSSTGTSLLGRTSSSVSFTRHPSATAERISEILE
ncbi:hypothetical protein QQX98_012409, partial [Neonectria punicea]